MSKDPSDPSGSGAPPSDLYRMVLREPRRLAKMLLRRLKAGDALAWSEFERLHPRAEQIRNDVKLTHVQLVLARSRSYRSWPQMMQHLEMIERCRADIDRGAPAPDGELHTVHVRCGSDIEQPLKKAGYVGDFVEFADPYCQGPTPPGDRDAFIETRAGFVAHAYELELEPTRARLQREWAALDGLDRYERVVLWFEHDSYDQFILAAILDALRGRNLPCVELICIWEYPGRRRFKGLGELDPAGLRGLWDARRPVQHEDAELGTSVWNSLRSKDPTALSLLRTSGTPRIPPMAGAIRRHLMELPWTSDGLGLTQRLAVEAVGAGTDKAGPVFRVVNNSLEPLPYLGDIMFWWELRELAAGGALRFEPREGGWPKWGVELTDLGVRLLNGEADWIEAARRIRWVGGVPCGPGNPPWRWDPEQNGPTVR